MHERETSDPVIGAGKPTNKAETTSVTDAAEPVEQRAGAKGNASGQSTHRIQSRERVSQALDRVRQAARLRKKEKLTALLHHIGVLGFSYGFRPGRGQHDALYVLCVVSGARSPRSGRA